MKIPTRDWCEIHETRHMQKQNSLKEYLSKFSEEELAQWSRDGKAPDHVVLELAALVIVSRAELMERLK